PDAVRELAGTGSLPVDRIGRPRGVGRRHHRPPRAEHGHRPGRSRGGRRHRPAEYDRDRTARRERVRERRPGGAIRRRHGPMSIGAARAYGPSAMGGDRRRFLELTLTLARTEFKVRYFGSTLGYLWSLIRPLLFFGVIYLFFTVILNLS